MRPGGALVMLRWQRRGAHGRCPHGPCRFRDFPFPLPFPFRFPFSSIPIKEALEPSEIRLSSTQRPTPGAYRRIDAGSDSSQACVGCVRVKCAHVKCMWGAWGGVCLSAGGGAIVQGVEVPEGLKAFEVLAKLVGEKPVALVMVHKGLGTVELAEAVTHRAEFLAEAA